MSETKERIKTVLICVLLLGMVYLIYAVWFFDSPFGESGIYNLFGTSSREVFSEGEGSDVESFGIRPLAVFVRGEGFSRGVVYDTATSDKVYNVLRPELKKAFAGAKDTTLSTVERWNEAILGEGVLLDYKGNVPLEAIKLWLGISEGDSSVCGRYYMFSTAKRTVVLYIKSGESDVVYEINTALNSEELQRVVKGISAPAAMLAAERREEDFTAVAPETVIADARQKFSVIAAYNSAATFGASVTNACLEGFGLLDVSPRMYSEADGTIVYVADMVTLRLGANGIAEYSDARDNVDETLGIGVEFDGLKPNLAEKTEAARSLATKIASALPGGGGIYIIDVFENGNKTEVVFGRHIGGVPVDMYGSIFFMRVEIEENSIGRVQFNLRGYDVSAQTADTLSERLAAAAIKGSGMTGDMNLRYSDNGGSTVAPSWHIGGARKMDEEEADNELVES